MPKAIGIQNSLDIFWTSQSWLGQSLPDFRFVNFHFNACTPTRITKQVRNVSDEGINLYLKVNFVNVFAFTKLVSVQSLRKLMNTR